MRPEHRFLTHPLQPSTSDPSPHATIHPTHPDLTVSFGQATFDSEGLEARGAYFSRVIHWPGGSSGVTIGRGYDMGQRTRLQVISELRHAGVQEDDALFLAAAAGLRGEVARRYVRSHLAESPVLSLPAQRRLFEMITAPETVADIKRLLAKPDLQARYGRVSWEELTPMAREVLFDLRYRGDYTPETRIRIQPLVVSGDDAGLSRVLVDRAYWTARGVPAERINARSSITSGATSYRMAS